MTRRWPISTSSTCPDPTCSSLRWANEVVDGGRWCREIHGFDTVPLYVRESAVSPLSALVDGPDHDYLDGLELRVFSGRKGGTHLTGTEPAGAVETTDGTLVM